MVAQVADKRPQPQCSTGQYYISHISKSLGSVNMSWIKKGILIAIENDHSKYIGRSDTGRITKISKKMLK